MMSGRWSQMNWSKFFCLRSHAKRGILTQIPLTSTVFFIFNDSNIFGVMGFLPCRWCTMPNRLPAAQNTASSLQSKVCHLALSLLAYFYFLSKLTSFLWCVSFAFSTIMKDRYFKLYEICCSTNSRVKEPSCPPGIFFFLCEEWII